MKREFVCILLKKEFSEYKTNVTYRSFNDLDRRIFWLERQENNFLCHLVRLARFFMSVSSSEIPQGQQFSELKKRCAGLRNRAKIGTLDRDAVVFSWIDERFSR